jgi:hypothetical protein
MEFTDVIKQIIDQNVRLSIHYGKVTAIVSSPKSVSVRLSGSTTAISGVRYLDSYVPQVNDIVVCIVDKGNVFILGDFAS